MESLLLLLQVCSSLTFCLLWQFVKHEGLEQEKEIEESDQPQLVEENGGTNVGGAEGDIDLDLREGGTGGRGGGEKERG